MGRRTTIVPASVKVIADWLVTTQLTRNKWTLRKLGVRDPYARQPRLTPIGKIYAKILKDALYQFRRLKVGYRFPIRDPKTRKYTHYRIEDKMPSANEVRAACDAYLRSLDYVAETRETVKPTKAAPRMQAEVDAPTLARHALEKTLAKYNLSREGVRDPTKAQPTLTPIGKYYFDGIIKRASIWVKGVGVYFYGGRSYFADDATLKAIASSKATLRRILRFEMNYSWDKPLWKRKQEEAAKEREAKRAEVRKRAAETKKQATEAKWAEARERRAEQQRKIKEARAVQRAKRAPAARAAAVRKRTAAQARRRSAEARWAKARQLREQQRQRYLQSRAVRRRAQVARAAQRRKLVFLRARRR